MVWHIWSGFIFFFYYLMALTEIPNFTMELYLPHNIVSLCFGAVSYHFYLATCCSLNFLHMQYLSSIVLIFHMFFDWVKRIVYFYLTSLDLGAHVRQTIKSLCIHWGKKYIINDLSQNFKTPYWIIAIKSFKANAIIAFSFLPRVVWCYHKHMYWFTVNCYYIVAIYWQEGIVLAPHTSSCSSKMPFFRISLYLLKNCTI